MASDASLILLAVTFLISAFTGNAKDSFLGMIVLTVAFSLGVYIKYRSSLRITNSYALLLPNAKVIENGLISSLSVYDVEVNDLITFSQGDIITADARLVSSTALVVAERVINKNTGLSEFKKYHKDHLFISTGEIAIHSPNMVYAGSMVISGKGSAIVTAIGSDTEISKVQTAITIVSENDKPSFFNVFESKSKKFSLAVLLSVIPLCLLGLLLNSASGGDGLDIMTMFLLSLALAATTMSEPLICAAEAIRTKEILPSSIASKSLKRPASKITKLSSAE
jgi:Ca2+-transporting ATPase